MVWHLPPSVYQKTGASEMFPKLLQIFQPDSLRCVQFLRSGKIRVTFREKAVRDYYLSEGVRFEGQANPMTRACDITVPSELAVRKWLARMSSTQKDAAFERLSTPYRNVFIFFSCTRLIWATTHMHS